MQPTQGSGACLRLRPSKVHLGLRGVGRGAQAAFRDVDFMLPAAIRHVVWSVCRKHAWRRAGLGKGELSAEHRRGLEEGLGREAGGEGWMRAEGPCLQPGGPLDADGAYVGVAEAV